MNNEIDVKIKEKVTNKYREGYPLIVKEAIINVDDLEVAEESTIVRLVDDKGRFIARGYFGKQNKGYGWVLTQNEKEAIDQAFFTKKIAAACAYRQPFFEDEETTAFRLFNGEGDGIGGFTIDNFASHYVINWYSEGIYAFNNYIIEALQSVTEVKSVYQKKRFDTKGKYLDDDDFVCGEAPDFPLLVKENGAQFAVYLNDGAMVGVFLDQREVRKAIRDRYAADKQVLNMFSYTGAFL